jgi:RHS repeat-associated protein
MRSPRTFMALAGVSFVCIMLFSLKSFHSYAAGSATVTGRPPAEDVVADQQEAEPRPLRYINPNKSLNVRSSAPNQLPVAVDDGPYNAHGGSSVIGPTLANDYDPEGDIFVVNGVVTPTSHGQITNNGGGYFIYYPWDGYTGPDSFTYNLWDTGSGFSQPATVTLNVVNQAPLAVTDFYSVSGVTTIGPLKENDFDPDGDDVRFDGVITQPAHGQAAFIGGDGVIRYYPDQGFSGIDSFTYRIFDYGLSSLGTVYVDVGGTMNWGSAPCNKRVGRPINVTNGNMYLQQSDYALPGAGPAIDITRTYNSSSQQLGLFGRGWTTFYDESIDTYDTNLAGLVESDGRRTYLLRQAGSYGTYEPLQRDFHGSLAQNGSNGFTLTTKDGTARQFNAAGKLTFIADRQGNQTTVAYDTSGKLVSLSDTFGRVLSFNTNASGQVLTVADTMGTIATYTYGVASQLLSVTYPDNSAFHFAYDGSLRLTTITDALGNVVESHTYDNLGRALTSEIEGGVEHYSLNYISATETNVTDALGHLTKYIFDASKGRSVVTNVEGICTCGGSQSQSWTYDSQLNVTSHTNALGQATTYTYDVTGNKLSGSGELGSSSFTYNQLGQVLTATDAMAGVTTYTYDAIGNLLSVRDALNNITSFAYNSRGELLTMTNALGKATTLAYDASGNVSQVTDAAGGITKFAYDARGRVTSATNALNFITRYAYDPTGRVNKITRPDLTFVTFTYDLAGRRTKVTDALNNSTIFAYDGAYRLTSQTDALGKTVTFAYDLMSNLTTTTDALGKSSDYEYDEFNRLLKAIYPPAVAGGTRLQELVEYDASGNVTKRTDTAGQTTSFGYDTANRLVTVTDPALQRTQYEYDARSNVTALVDALGQRHTFDYDDLSRLTATTRAGLANSFAYDAIGNRVQRTDYNNLTTTYSYDAVNRLTNVSYPDASVVTYAYDKLSQLTSAANLNGTVSFSHDSLGRTTSTTDVFGQVLNFAYDANDRRTRLSFGTTTNATYTYDAVNQLTKITDSANLAIAYAYDGAGRLISRTLPNSTATTYTYDGLNRLTRLTDAKKKTVIADNNYQYNAAGNLSQNIDQSGTHVYGYDPMERLTSATYSGTPNEIYAYDAVGNRTNSHRSANYSYQPDNRLVATATASYLYDNNGNMISKAQSGTTVFAWDFENRLTQVVTPSAGSVTYKYDALGRRIQRTASSGTSTNFIYDGQDVVKDINSDGTSLEYLNGLGIDNKIRQKGPSAATTYYFAQDRLGSTTALTNTKGQLVERLAYDGYGNSAGSTRTRYTFTGRERDSLTGLLHYRARSYDPQLGRFISEDPIGLSGGINQFAYVRNNPQNAKDPSGLYEIDVHYYLTYFLAMKTGCFTDNEARLIADADQATDENSITSPGPGWTAQQRKQNRENHDLQPGNHEGQVSPELWREAMNGPTNLGGLGRSLHFNQDSFSHAGFENDIAGHISRLHYYDKTDSDVPRALRMAAATWDLLNQYAKEKKCGCQGKWDAVWWQQVIDFSRAPGANFGALETIDSNGELENLGMTNTDWYLRNKIRILHLAPR